MDVTSGGDILGVAQYCTPEDLKIILRLLCKENRIACTVAARYGLRISDVLNMKTEDIRSKTRMTFKEQKTGKKRTLTIPDDLRSEMLSISGKIYIFEHRDRQTQHRTRQAVWKDIKRAAEALRLPGISTHSMRKAYAVRMYERYGDLEKVQKLLNHVDSQVTMLYALADHLTRYKAVKSK